MRHTILAVLLLFSFYAHGGGLKDWTFLVYLNGHNNLSDFGPFNIHEMEQMGSTTRVNIIVQWASAHYSETGLVNDVETKRLYVLQNTQNTDATIVTSPTLQTLTNVDMGSSKSLVDFIVWGAKHFPAKHYFVSVWDHGGGWHLQNLTFNPNSLGYKDISWDEGSKSFITTAELGNAMYEAASQIGQKIDIYGSDACLMAMPEVSTEMRKAVDFFVGSEETEPGQGWPYSTIVAHMNLIADDSPENVAKIIVNDYVDSYLPGGVHFPPADPPDTPDYMRHKPPQVTYSAIDLRKESQVFLLSAVRKLSAAVKDLNKSQKVQMVAALNATQRFTYSDYGDLIDFMDQIDSLKITTPDLKAAMADMRLSLKSLIIAHRETPEFAKAHGLSMWLPTDLDTLNAYYKKYQTLDFSQITGWGEALKSLDLPKQCGMFDDCSGNKVAKSF